MEDDLLYDLVSFKKTLLITKYEACVFESVFLLRKFLAKKKKRQKISFLKLILDMNAFQTKFSNLHYS